MKSYHDYVIHDGKFIGMFDEMYCHVDDPWNQSQQPNKYARMAGIIHLRNFGIKTVIECGCGLGFYSDWIRRETGMIPKSIDISEVAVKKAKKIFPDLDFEVADVSKDLKKYNTYDCVMFAEIIWYILPQLNDIFDVLKTHFKGKHLVINQVFYKGTQQYGTEYFTNLKELIDYIPFKLLGQCEATTVNDPTIETSTIFHI